MSLFSMYWREIIAAIEEKHAAIYKGGCFKVAALKHQDDAIPHQDALYQWEISEEICWRYCILFNQPPQPPIKNEKEVCLFPMWTNNVSNNQAISFGSQLLTG